MEGRRHSAKATHSTCRHLVDKARAVIRTPVNRPTIQQAQPNKMVSATEARGHKFVQAMADERSVGHIYLSRSSYRPIIHDKSMLTCFCQNLNCEVATPKNKKV